MRDRAARLRQRPFV